MLWCYLGERSSCRWVHRTNLRRTSARFAHPVHARDAAVENDAESGSCDSQLGTSVSPLPEYEQWQDDDLLLLPKREPGNFPVTSHSVHKVGTSDRQQTQGDEQAVYDPLRDGPLRYCGYANELGEAWAAWLPAFGLPLSYAIAVAYVLVDTVDKAQRAYDETSAALPVSEGTDEGWNRVALLRLVTSERAVDTLLWQLLASVAIPGFCVHQVVHLSHLCIVAGLHLNTPAEMAPEVSAIVSSLAVNLGVSPDEVCYFWLKVIAILDRVGPTAFGLLVIPLIVHPIDNAVHFIMNMSLRPYMQHAICRHGGGCQAGLASCQLPQSPEMSAPVAGASVSSYDYASCLEAENCSVTREYRVHGADTKVWDVRRALLKAFLLTGPIAVALLATLAN